MSAMASPFRVPEDPHTPVEPSKDTPRVQEPPGYHSLLFWPLGDVLSPHKAGRSAACRRVHLKGAAPGTWFEERRAAAWGAKLNEGERFVVTPPPVSLLTVD